ncbi:hypothetical protein RchiOBHm_Chr4g0401071 [Rosa chinensis]|uniref:Uncharacterized protein n=1 Tax=Rosa chinensis TaxID=74649 RepID=A0A2P6QSZ6_ROSCH|nr:hypothetical protein RchiOBHm_Chr4g0401071 [Rosa chinensis]
MMALAISKSVYCGILFFLVKRNAPVFAYLQAGFITVYKNIAPSMKKFRFRGHRLEPSVSRN